MPRFNPEATGVFFGVTASTTRAHMARAIIEGIAFQYPPSVDALRSYGLNISELTVVDGEARSACGISSRLTCSGSTCSCRR